MGTPKKKPGLHGFGGGGGRARPPFVVPAAGARKLRFAVCKGAFNGAFLMVVLALVAKRKRARRRAKFAVRRQLLVA